MSLVDNGLMKLNSIKKVHRIFFFKQFFLIKNFRKFSFKIIPENLFSNRNSSNAKEQQQIRNENVHRFLFSCSFVHLFSKRKKRNSPSCWL